MRFLLRLKIRSLEEKGSTFTVVIFGIIFLLATVCLITFTSRLSTGVNKLKEFAMESCVVQESENTDKLR